MIQFPHAKINLGLSVQRRRADGFHDIETIFYPVALYEAIEILPAAETSLTVSGLAIPGSQNDNLLLRAWRMVKQFRPDLPPTQILLHKAIPMGAGLGGGSSDAARLLLMLNEFYSLKIDTAALHDMAAQLGSDCAFFLQRGACTGSGRGEILEPVPLNLSGYEWLLIHPDIAVSTAWAYSQIVPAPPEIPMKTLAALPPTEWAHVMRNDFEPPVFAAYPLLAEIRSALYGAGAVYAAMSGSGSSLFGLFKSGSRPDNFLGGRFDQTRLPANLPVW